MTKDNAIDVLERFQKWRTGEDKRTMEDAGIVPRKISEAILIAIKSLKSECK